MHPDGRVVRLEAQSTKERTIHDPCPAVLAYAKVHADLVHLESVPSDRKAGSRKPHAFSKRCESIAGYISLSMRQDADGICLSRRGNPARRPAEKRAAGHSNVEGILWRIGA